MRVVGLRMPWMPSAEVCRLPAVQPSLLHSCRAPAQYLHRRKLGENAYRKNSTAVMFACLKATERRYVNDLSNPAKL